MDIEDYLKESRGKYSNYVKNKRIILVGPSDHLTDSNYGKKIDSYDIVFRLNRGLNIDEKYFNDIGHRADVLSTCLYIPSCGTLDVNKWKNRGIKWVVNPLSMKAPFGKDSKAYYDKFGDLFNFHVGDTENWIKIENQLKTRPNTGLATIFDLLLFEPKEIHVCGFSFYSTKFIESYNTKHANDTLQDTIEITHKQEPQRNFFFDLMEKHKDIITVDWYIQDLYNRERKR